MKNALFPLLILLTGLLISFSVISACGDDDDDDDSVYADDDDNDGDDDDGWDDYRNALPDEASLTLTIPEKTQKALGELAVWYDATVDLSRDVNGHILLFLGHIDEITSYSPTEVDGATLRWGPWTDPYTPPTSVEMMFEMTDLGGGQYEYFLYFRPKNSQDDWTPVWEGNIQSVSSTARRGIGDFMINFTDAQLLDPTINESGSIEVEYDTSGPSRTIDIAYFDFYSTDWQGGDGPPEPIDATYSYFNDSDNSGNFLFDWWDDIHQNDPTMNQYDEMEHLWFTTRWISSGSGRSDVVVTDGDMEQVGIDQFGTALDKYKYSECWEDDFLTSYSFVALIDTNGSELYSDDEGDDTTCVFAADFRDVTPQ